jgi:glutamate synthase (NADPH/NADH)
MQYALYRLIAHNGEINTLKGNVNLMHAREGVMKSSLYGEQLSKLYPVIEEGMSDSGCFDNVLEFLCMAGGRELPEVTFSLVKLTYCVKRSTVCKFVVNLIDVTV